MHRPIILLTCADSHANPIEGIGPVGAKGPVAVPSLYLKVPYVQSVEAAGGVPLVLPHLDDEEALAAALDRADGLLLTGGGDVDPARYGQAPRPGLRGVHPARDAVELAVFHRACRRGLPVLGICRGHQLLNVARGGTLIQDIASCHRPGPGDQAVGHDGTRHPVRFEGGSRIAEMVGSDATVNSTHHQAVDALGESLRVTGRSPDGLIEAVEGRDGARLLGLQCHPERMWQAQREFLEPFRWLVEQARAR